MGLLWQHNALLCSNKPHQLTGKLPQSIARTGEVYTHLHPLVLPLQIPPSWTRGCLYSLPEGKTRPVGEQKGPGGNGAQWFPKGWCETQTWRLHSVYRGLTYSYASSGVREPSTTFASALPCAKHERHVSEAGTWLLCSSGLGLQNEIPPDLRRVKGVCFNTLMQTSLFVTKLSGWHSGLSLFIYYMLFSLLHFHC